MSNDDKPNAAMSSDDKPSVYQAENVVEKRRRRGCLSHCVKFWWAYLIGLICVVVLVVCLVIFVGVPRMAQDKIDGAELTVDGIVITGTHGQNLTMAINSTIRSDGSVRATIDGFVGDMYLEDLEPHTPFASVQFPETTSDALQTVNISQLLDIKDMAALTTFNTWLLTNDSLRITIRGDTYIHVNGIAKAFPVTFKKTITTPGLRGFNGTNVYNTTVTIAGDENGNNFHALTNIPNYSVFTLEIGNTTFHNYLLGKEVGTVYIDNIVLYPGLNNTFPLRAKIDNGAVLEVLGQSPYCDKTKGVLPFQLRGNTVVNHGQPLSYFADALASHNQTIDIDIGTPVTKLLGSPIPCGGLHF